ncbi:cardiolipin synthase [Methanomicrobium sp. W14]|uniref:cardiolipin synthase n=1 Tax=Methanomicrobium sp. W14 TaxID=2817839 RepID=UPI001FD8AD56|nr:cardiolipin synthase [Methanomicrobium sp. W14]MBP2133058.1 cardiolipin synthase [Methanomicrobium sp. W14]
MMSFILDYILSSGTGLISDIHVLILIINFFFAVSIIFIERRDPTSALLWVTILALIPIAGIIAYLIFGQNLYKAKIFRIKEEDDRKIQEIISRQKEFVDNIRIPWDDKAGDYIGLVRMLLETNYAEVTDNNEVEIYTDGRKKFEALIEAIKSAKESVNIQYYVIRNDEISKKIISILAEKARQGVKVRVLGDAVGCHQLPRNFFDELKKAGGETAFFFRSKYLHINIRINYRNHRKIAVIDGKTGFIGGFNLGDEYLGKGPLGYWRDTHLKITGGAVYSLQSRFFLDWNHAAEKDIGFFDGMYFPRAPFKRGTFMQIASSGPDSQGESIKMGYIKLINNARESILIQTPYFIPDKSILDSLKIAAGSGVDVKIMFPCRPDHPFVYWAGFSYLWELMESGVRVFTYNRGFIHAKTIVVDGMASSVGSANWDIRSFSLNFESNAFIYDETVSGKLKNIFEEDLKYCSEKTNDDYNNRTVAVRFKESISRLFSQVL